MELKTCPIHFLDPDAEKLSCRDAVDKEYVDAQGGKRRYRLPGLSIWRIRCPACYAEKGPFGKGLGAGVKAPTFEEAAEKWNKKCMDAAVKAVVKAARSGEPLKS